jgi:hypothetical protein
LRTLEWSESRHMMSKGKVKRVDRKYAVGQARVCRESIRCYRLMKDSASRASTCLKVFPATHPLIGNTS